MPCGEADALAKSQELTHCAACGKEFQRGQLVNYQGSLACEECVNAGAVAAAVKSVRQSRPMAGMDVAKARKISIFVAAVIVLVIVYLLFHR